MKHYTVSIRHNRAAALGHTAVHLAAGLGAAFVLVRLGVPFLLTLPY